MTHERPAVAEVQRVLDRHEGDVDDRGVEHDHQLTGDDDGQGDS